VHTDIPGNVAAHFVQTVGDPDKVFADAPHIIRETLLMDRGAAMPMECRGVLARWDAYEGLLTCWISTQGPIPIRNGLAAIFQLPEHKVRVIAPDVGGGFGTKITMFYPEEIVTACTLPGPYRLKDYYSEFTVLYTNKVPVSPYRGAGRPHAVFVMERIMDRIAKELNLDRAEARARNFIQPDEFPWDVGLVYQ